MLMFQYWYGTYRRYWLVWYVIDHLGLNAIIKEPPTIQEPHKILEIQEKSKLQETNEISKMKELLNDKELN